MLTCTTTVAPPRDLPPNLSHFSKVSENEILKIIKNSPTKTCLLDPLFFTKTVWIFYSHLLQNNWSLNEDVFPQQFKRAVIDPTPTPLLRKYQFQVTIIIRYQDYVLCQNWRSSLLSKSLCNTSAVTIWTILIN